MPQLWKGRLDSATPKDNRPRCQLFGVISPPLSSFSILSGQISSPTISILLILCSFIMCFLMIWFISQFHLAAIAADQISWLDPPTISILLNSKNFAWLPAASNFHKSSGFHLSLLSLQKLTNSTFFTWSTRDNGHGSSCRWSHFLVPSGVLYVAMHYYPSRKFFAVQT